MNPSKDVLAVSSVEIDLAPIPTGQGITVMWQGKPIFVRHRTDKEIAEARDVKLSDLPDPQADKARVKAGHDQWIVLIGICTHLGQHPARQQADGYARGVGRLGSAPATAVSTTPRDASAKDRR